MHLCIRSGATHPQSMYCRIPYIPIPQTSAPSDNGPAVRNLPLLTCNALLDARSDQSSYFNSLLVCSPDFGVLLSTSESLNQFPPAHRLWSSKLLIAARGKLIRISLAEPIPLPRENNQINSRCLPLLPLLIPLHIPRLKWKSLWGDSGPVFVYPVN